MTATLIYDREIQGYRDADSLVGPTGPAGAAGAAGATGAQGGFGGDSQPFAFSTTTTDADPGNGVIRFNHATLPSATIAYIDLLNSDTVDITAWIDALDDSTSSTKGVLRFFKKNDQSVFHTFQINAANTTATGYRKLNLTYITGNGAFADTDPIVVSFTRQGDVGATGATGTTGGSDIPQNSQSAAYTLVIGDVGKHIYHPSSDTTARTWTIPANSSVAFGIGTAVSFVNDTSAGVITIAITTDTLVFSSAGTTGSRTLAAGGMATALKIGTTRWIISGTGLT